MRFSNPSCRDGVSEVRIAEKLTNSAVLAAVGPDQCYVFTDSTNMYWRQLTTDYAGPGGFFLNSGSSVNFSCTSPPGQDCQLIGPSLVSCAIGTLSSPVPQCYCTPMCTQKVTT